MDDILSSGREGAMRAILPLIVFLALAAPAAASESCAMLGGACRDSCRASESAEAGAFEDCGSQQECCVGRATAPVQCCILSTDTKDFGPANCAAPKDGACPNGASSPAPCSKLRMCATMP